MSNSVKLVCNCNFNTSEEKVDKMVFKIFKMFHDKLTSNSSPIDKDTSDITCVYVYDKLTTENVRIFKKLAESNKTSIYLNEIIVTDEPVVENKDSKDEKNDKSGNGSESDGSESDGSVKSATKSDKKVLDSIPPNTESPKLETVKSEKDVINSESSGSESSGSDSDSSGSDSDSESDTNEEATTGKLIASIETTVASLLTDLEELKKKIQ